MASRSLSALAGPSSLAPQHSVADDRTRALECKLARVEGAGRGLGAFDE